VDDDRGFTTIQFVVATAFSLVLFVLVANLLVDLYARGAVRDALDEGVRAQVPGAAPADACEARARGVIGSIAHGSVVQIDELRCERDGARVRAVARVSLPSWLGMPAWHVVLRASAETEQ
jgi:hypothetical protein